MLFFLCPRGFFLWARWVKRGKKGLKRDNKGHQKRGHQKRKGTIGRIVLTFQKLQKIVFESRHRPIERAPIRSAPLARCATFSTVRCAFAFVSRLENNGPILGPLFFASVSFALERTAFLFPTGAPVRKKGADRHGLSGQPQNGTRPRYAVAGKRPDRRNSFSVWRAARSFAVSAPYGLPVRGFTRCRNVDAFRAA